ncbi:MAG: hypothetical protein CMH49_08060 [Myxococcales bacterium]|nr:hypothetical protein [Myxococcales bacterium]
MSNGDHSSIAVCDLCLNNEIHETVNLGFLYGLSLISPKQDILFYADEGHQEIIKTNTKTQGLNLEQIRYIHIPSNLNASYWGYILSYIRIKRILDHLIQLEVKKLLILSSVDFQRLILKKLLKRKCYQGITCCFVMHGDLDCLISPKHKSQEVQEVAGTYFWVEFYFNFKNYLKIRIKYALKKCQNYLTPKINFKAHLLANHSSQIRYIVLAPHILTQLSNYIDTDYLAFHYVPHPAVFRKPHSLPQYTPSKKLKCAIFGYGNPPTLFDLNRRLAQLWQTPADQKEDLRLHDLAHHLEIRMISSNHQGTEAFSWVSTPIKGRTLNRSEMEELIQDIDLLLILYESHRYQLSCSGSIIEALSYQKPVFFLDNPCIRSFNTTDQPIGQNFGTIQELALGLLNYIHNPEKRTIELEKFRQNIMYYRPQVDIKLNLSKLRLALDLKDHSSV